MISAGLLHLYIFDDLCGAPDKLKAEKVRIYMQYFFPGVTMVLDTGILVFG